MFSTFSFCCPGLTRRVISTKYASKRARDRDPRCYTLLSFIDIHLSAIPNASRNSHAFSVRASPRNFFFEQKILDLLAEDDNDHSALKACSLVCQTFLHICRKHIFGSITLDDNHAISHLATHALTLLLCERPEIADYIRKLDYTIEVGDLTSPSIQESLQRISRLQCLMICHRSSPNLDWSNNPIRPVLLHLLHLPTLTHFEVTNIDNFVVSDLIPCVNLKYLSIGFHTTAATETTFPAALPEQSIQLNEFVAATRTADAITKLCKTRRPDGRPVVDFGSLSKMAVFLRKLNEGEALQELSRRCQVLTHVNISCK